VTAHNHRTARRPIALAAAFELYASLSTHDPSFCIQYTESTYAGRACARRDQNEESLVLGNTACWGSGGIYDVSSRRVTGSHCSAHSDQPCGVVGHRIEDSFQLASNFRFAHVTASRGPALPGESPALRVRTGPTQGNRREQRWPRASAHAPQPVSRSCNHGTSRCN
jgi:hypothetical protein